MLLHWLYPRYCELCRKSGPHELCPECIRRLPHVPQPICGYCGAPQSEPQPDANQCPRCMGRQRSFTQARSALATAADTLRLVYALKYHRAIYLAEALGGVVLNALWESTPALARHSSWCIVPVPIGRAHLQQRGYNQAAELAQALARARGLPMAQPLIRRATGVASQTLLSAPERRKNAMASYDTAPEWLSGERPLGAHIVLVDDVYTTGSTARACAGALRRIPGVKEVVVLTLLRAMRRQSY